MKISVGDNNPAGCYWLRWSGINDLETALKVPGRAGGVINVSILAGW